MHEKTLDYAPVCLGKTAEIVGKGMQGTSPLFLEAPESRLPGRGAGRCYPVLEARFLGLDDDSLPDEPRQGLRHRSVGDAEPLGHFTSIEVGLFVYDLHEMDFRGMESQCPQLDNAALFQEYQPVDDSSQPFGQEVRVCLHKVFLVYKNTSVKHSVSVCRDDVRAIRVSLERGQEAPPSRVQLGTEVPHQLLGFGARTVSSFAMTPFMEYN